MSFTATLLITLAAFGSAHEAPADARPREERIVDRCRTQLEAFARKTSVPGASFALILPGGEELGIAVGKASEEQELTPEHRLLSGSVGKTYVTAAAHHLVAAGALALDDRAASFFEDAEWLERVPNARAITVRQLLRHQTGIPRYVFQPGFWGAIVEAPDRVWKPAELLAYVFDAEPLFAPGEGWAYADTNYIVVGMVVEAVSGERFYDYVRENLLEPHELADTIPTDTLRVARMAQGHVVTCRQFGVPEHTLEDGSFAFNVQFEWCGGGWANTPLDLARWARILYSGEAFEAPYLETMLDVVPAPALGPGARYGLGVIVRDTEHGRVLGHDGFMPGYLTTIGYLPEHDVAFALQLNTDDTASVGPLLPVVTELVAIAREELADE